MKDTVWLIGAGYMAREYAKVLKSFGVEFTTVGRGEASGRSFEEEMGCPVVTGGLERFLSTERELPSHAVVASGVETLCGISRLLVENGVRNVLVEKPGGINTGELLSLSRAAESRDANVWIAYNRRFYASVLEASRTIDADGGVTSFNFEFTEWSDKIEKVKKPRQVKESWFLANSTHVVDLAFYLGGLPKTISCYTAGGLSWHPRSCVFTGAGVTETGALFSYSANWDGPGRWGVEVCTRQHRLIFRPLERLQVQNRDSVSIEAVEIDDRLDREYKPGLYRQVESFLSGRTAGLCPVSAQVRMFDVYQRIADYS